MKFTEILEPVRLSIEERDREPDYRPYVREFDRRLRERREGDSVTRWLDALAQRARRL